MPMNAWHDGISKPVAFVASALATLAVIVGAFLAVDDRYAHAGDLRQLSLEVQLQGLEARRNSLEDKVFDISQKKRTPGDQASLQRYTGELRDVKRDIQTKRQILDQMKAGK